ncbi:MAG: MBL fold metallo-hydrolase [Clostridia bacterium]|nr:MBL fold metallo-hydrolase [Clostridia bacterium]
MAKLHFLKSVTDTINTSFILESNDTLLVLDGGFPSEAPYLYEYLKDLGGHVDTWFLTHFHDDHFGCFLTILQEHPDIKIDNICYNFPSDEFIVKYEPKQSCKMSEEWLRIFKKTVADSGIPVVTATEGDVYTYDCGNVTVRVLRTYDEDLPYINDSSTVFLFEVDGKSILFLGDLAVAGGKQLLAKAAPEMVKADFVQMAHHGQGGVDKACYEAIKPTYCLWPTPSWVWNNMGPGGYDTNVYQTIIVRGWISSLRSVKKHYLMIDGTQVIDLTQA